MSTTGISDPNKTSKKPFHRRNDSGELDVFEAARYFSGATEVSGYNGTAFTHKIVSIPSQTDQHVMEKQMMKEKQYKQVKQPSSPGGRLASFLNSLFNQSSSKKKKSKSSTAKSVKDDQDESPGGRRKRRSSISHFRSASATDSKSNIYSSSSSGFRTPPPIYAHTPTKSYKDLRSYSDQKHVVMTLSKYNIGNAKPSATLQNEVCDDKRSSDYVCLDEKFKFTNVFPEKSKNSDTGFPEKDRLVLLGEEREFKKFHKVDDVGEEDSDSSSDLFELENYDLSYCSSGLPVYETTHMDTIKRGAPISNGAM